MTRIKKLREEYGMTQKQVSDLIGIPKRTLENYEQGSRQPAPWIERLLIKEVERLGENHMLKERIEKALEKEIMNRNTMGSEVASISLNLTAEEKASFLNDIWRFFDDKNHTWDVNNNELTVSWCEDGFWKIKYDVYTWEEELKHWEDIMEGCAIAPENSSPELLGSFDTLEEAMELLNKQEPSICRTETFTGHVWQVKEAWVEKNQYDSDGDLVDTLELVEASTDLSDAYAEAKERYNK